MKFAAQSHVQLNVPSPSPECHSLRIDQFDCECPKRIEKDSRVIDAILVGQSSNNWDGTLNTLADTPNNLTHVQRYFSDILGSLESSIDAKSKTLRRPMQTLLFQLNNYNYLAKGVRAISNELVDAAVVGKRYEQIIEALKRSFINR